MRSIQRSFNNTIHSRPGLSTYIAFATVIMGMDYGKSVIKKWFKKLVQKEDYLPSERDSLLEHLYHLSEDKELA